MMKLLLIGNELDTPQMRAAAAAEGCALETLSSRAFNLSPAGSPLEADAALVSRDHGDHDPFLNTGRLLGIPFVAALGAENMTAGISSLTAKENALCSQYVLYGGEQNLRSLIKYAKSALYGTPAPPKPERLPFDSIYTFDGSFYDGPASYMEQREAGYPAYVGILSYRTRWQGNDLEVEKALADAFHRRNTGVICAFSTGSPDKETGCLSMEQAIAKFFCIQGKPVIDLMINFIFFGTSEREAGERNTLFERAAAIFQRLDIPVLRPVQSNYLTNAQWEESPAPFTQDAALNYDTSEMQGMIEPVFIGGTLKSKQHSPVPERIEKLADRALGWIRLRKRENADKKVAIILNNAVCSGVEATLGRANGLNSFESAVHLLKRMEKEGYLVNDIPKDGEELRRLFLDKKAYSDFRWTSAEDIKAAGGLLYGMPAREYEGFYEKLEEGVQSRVEQMWGAPPGEAMVLEDQLLITGIRFGNVALMIQPKRGCYGAKCTGEVCRILQDPSCPPTHQYLATYWYIQNIFGADACLHFGTHGSLEFLPGKGNGPGGSCFPDIAIGRLPNLYVYHAESIGSALLAKRRSYAVTIDHRPDREQRHVLEQEELEAVLCGLNGSYIRPGQGGSLEDGPVLTGRNLYGVQIDKIPSRNAYERGAFAAEALVEQYLDKEGRYPEQIALNMISLDIPRTSGEQLSQMLCLLGVTPVWNERQTVTGLACIPLKELGRPRMDVSVHISGVLRDTWPEFLTMLDEAIALAASQNETPDENYVIRNLREAGKKEEMADIARIFGGAPGTYANSMGLALKASAWQDENDLARYFIDSSSYVYGKGKHGSKNVKAFLDGIRRTDVTCDLISMKHTDALNSSYSSRVQGGYALAAKALGLNKKVHSFMGESRPEGICVKTLNRHLEDGLRDTMLSGDWKRNMMELGYDGAAEFMCRIQNIFEMQCVGESFSSEILDELARQYALDGEMTRWMEEHNVHAAEETKRRFLELETRGKWKPDPEIINMLRRSYLKTEAGMEDGINGLGDIQAGNVDIVTDKSVDHWKKQLEEVDKEIGKWKKQSS